MGLRDQSDINRASGSRLRAGATPASRQDSTGRRPVASSGSRAGTGGGARSGSAGNARPAASGDYHSTPRKQTRGRVAVAGPRPARGKVAAGTRPAAAGAKAAAGPQAGVRQNPHASHPVAGKAVAGARPVRAASGNASAASRQGRTVRVARPSAASAPAGRKQTAQRQKPQVRSPKVALPSAAQLASAASSVRAHATRRNLIAAACVLAVLVLFGCWFTMWRSISVTVNSKEVTLRVGTSAADFLKDNDYFGMAAGRLLSVGGNTLEETGGDSCTLAIDGNKVAASDFADTKIESGMMLVVTDGADVTEDHTEETVEIEPSVEMESGGAIQYVSQWGKKGEKIVWTGKVSGEVVDHEVTEEATDMVIASRNCAPQGDGKYIALTFDDGPSQYTPQILEILEEKGVKATFFNLGSQAETYSDYCSQVVESGNELASHTNKHTYLPDLDRDSLRDEITSAAERLEAASGESPQMIRAPYGSFDTNCWLRSCDLISCNVLWNIDTLDWELPGADAITSEVLNSAYNGAIVLMHDGGGNRSQDVAALPDIIDGLQDAGYELVTVSELMKLDGTFPKKVVKGTVKQPKSAVVPAEVS